MLRSNKMAKCAISIGYKTFVMDAEQGVQLMEILGNAELYEEKYRGSGAPVTHHVYPSDDAGLVSLRLLPQGLYSMAKLAGKPDKE